MESRSVTRIQRRESGNTTGPISSVIIRPSDSWRGIDVRELLQYRGLFFFLVWRDIKVRYAQTVLGAAWAVIQPVVTMVVFTVVFGGLANIESDGLPYPVFSLCGLVPWTYFSTALRNSSMSLVSNPDLITKIYFPRLIIPTAPVLSGLVDFIIAFIILLGMVVAFGITPTLHSLWLVPLCLGIALLTALGMGLLLSGLNIQYRDVKHITPFFVQIWMYASPIVYPFSLVPEQFRLAYSLNPMVSVVEGFRTALTGTNTLEPRYLAASLLVTAVLLVTGIIVFRRAEGVFADVA